MNSKLFTLTLIVKKNSDEAIFYVVVSLRERKKERKKERRTLNCAVDFFDFWSVSKVSKVLNI